MTKRNLNFIFSIFFFGTLQSQTDSIINNLEEVLVKTKKISKSKLIGLKSVKISNNEIIKNPLNLTNLLRFNSPISIRDYGNGGVSTARFRGTSATNTLVLWNGLPINAVGNGQTDLNAFSVTTADEIVVTSGGGGVAYGSGAIGGVLEVKDNLYFEKKQQYQLFTSYGSFNTTSNFFKLNLSNNKWSSKFAISFNNSTNNYIYLDKRFRNNNGSLFSNENGSFTNYSVNFSLGYQFSKKNTLSFYTTKYYGNRFFSAGLPNPNSGSERNEDLNQRNLIKWQHSKKRVKQELNIAYLTQGYRYYNNKDATTFSFGKSKNTNINYNLNYSFSEKIKGFLGAVFDNIEGETNDIVPKTRKSVVANSGFSFKPNQLWLISINGRQEYNSDFNLPPALSVALEHNFSNNFQLNANISQNYRVPSFNELYWPKVGNLNLIPEVSLQGELGANYNFKNLSFSGTFFYINIKDKIIWRPSFNSNIWSPLNVDAANHRGFEAYAKYSYQISKRKRIQFITNYTLAIAQDKKSGSILPFSPKHLWNFNIDFSYRKIHLYLQNLYQSKVFTNPINIDVFALDKLSFANLGSIYTLHKSLNKELSLGIHINNIFNTVYYFSNLRPMPGINFNIHINYKF